MTVYWNTLYEQAALDQLKAENYPINESVCWKLNLHYWRVFTGVLKPLNKEDITMKYLSLLGHALYTALSVLGLSAISISIAHAIKVNENPALLQIYVNNVENLTGTESEIREKCRADYESLIGYIKSQDYAPDIFIVQQVSGEGEFQGQADFYANRLREELDPNWPTAPDPNYEYDYVIAESVPYPTTKGDCGEDNQYAESKKFQTNVIFYRTARLQKVTLNTNKIGSSVWQTKKENCVDNDQTRTKSVAELFYDNLTGAITPRKKVAVASMHWVTGGSGRTTESSECNIDDINTELESYDSDLIIFGGDANHDDSQSWYERGNGALADTAPVNFGYTDPIYQICLDANGIIDSTCLDDNFTFINSVGTTTRRIDFIFTKQPGYAETVATNQHTISFSEVEQSVGSANGVNYSDHKAIRSRIYYGDPLAFKSPHPITKPSVRSGESYPPRALVNDVRNPNNEILTFSLINDPSWLDVAPNGELNGTPGSGDIGLNKFRVRVDGQSGAYDEVDMEIRVNVGLVLSEVLYDISGTDDEWEWVELYNGTSLDINLLGYSLGYGGTSYIDGVAPLSGIIQAGQTFLVGGPETDDKNSNPVYDLDFDFNSGLNPGLLNSDGQNDDFGDGVALFDVPASQITSSLIPIDAVVYGSNNTNHLIDETGADNAPEVGDAGPGQSIERIDSAGNWQVQTNPTPNQTSLIEDACGDPDYDRRTERELFIWQDCVGDGTWYIRATTGGGSALTYQGNLTTDQAFSNVENFSIESSDIVDVDANDQKFINFNLMMGSVWHDGFNFKVAQGNTCLTLDAPAGIKVLAGVERIQVGSPFDIHTLESCQPSGPAIISIVSTRLATEPHTEFKIEVTSDTPVSEEIKLVYHTQVGTATHVAADNNTGSTTNDYGHVSNESGSGIHEISIPQGGTSANILVNIKQDNVSESAETFTVNLTDLTNADTPPGPTSAAVIENGTSTITIQAN